MDEIKLFEIPIYAISKENLKLRVSRKEKHLREKFTDQDTFQKMKEMCILPFSSWEYNHIVGVIKIYLKDYSVYFDIYGEVPWGERYCWYTSKRKAIKNRQLIGCHFYIGHENSNESIQFKIKNYLIKNIIDELIPSNYYADVEAFLNLNQQVDYLKIIEKV